jgi:hypothetical protein
MTGTHTVSENPLPTNLSLSANPATICNGQSATLTATANGAASYSIDNNAWQTTTTFNVSPTSNQSYTLFVRTAAGCTASTTHAATVAVNAAPNAPTMSGGGSQCGGTRSITATRASNGTGIRWTDTGNTTATRSVGTGTYYAVTTSANGCESAAASVSVTINTIPVAPTMRGSSSYCTSGTITATYGTGGNGIKWDNNSTTSLRTVDASGTYRAVTTSAAGCTSSTATITVTIVQPGASGYAKTACGCANGLNDCSGTCQVSCANFTACSGFTEVTNAAYEGAGLYGLNQAAEICASKGLGWGLPSPANMKCLCEKQSALPGGYVLNGPYWVAYYGGSETAQVMWFESCITSDIGLADWWFVKCIK